jgi:O-antigen/teichoic acid export membrane protein
MESIRHKVVRSSFWSLGGNWLSILSVNVLNVFSETGVEAALIQKDKIGRTELDIAWTLGIVRGLLLFTLLFLSAGLIASYFDNMTLKPVLRAMSATFLLGGFTNIGIIYFQKELDFKKKVILDSIADISGAVSAVFLAFYIRNVWALVAGTIVWVMVKCLASYSLHPYRPKIRWDWPVAKNLLNYGKHIFWISVVRLTTLGFYTMAYNIANVPVSSLTGIIGRISFPAYSIMQKNPERLKEAFRKIFETVLIILLPFTVLIILLDAYSDFSEDWPIYFLPSSWLLIVPQSKAGIRR